MKLTLPLILAGTIAFAQQPAPPKKAELPPDVVEHAGLPADKAAAVAKVPEGYELRVFAAEPAIINPIAFALDDRARVWAVEGITYPQRAKDTPDTKPGMGGKNRVLVFEDTDGDGKHDKRTVFLEGVNLVSGIEVGHGGVWLGAAPYLLFVPVTDWENPKPAGDAKVMLDGWGFQDTHETLNTFHWGPDGWLYGCHGVFTHSKVGKPGTADKDRVKINAGIWRYHPQRHTFEVFSEGTSNPWGMDWNEDGELFIEACVIPHLFHMIPGARYTRQAGAHFNPYTYDDIKTIADHRHYLGGNPHGGNGKSDAAGGGHAHAGLCIPQHPSWPASIRGNALMGNIHGSRINMDILERKGSGYVGKHGADFINFNDKASQIIDIREGPDGTLFMIDWYDLNQCHRGERTAHDYTTGRIYVLAKKGSKVKQRDVSGGETETLVRIALEADTWLARQACRNLKERTQALSLEAIQKIWTRIFTDTPPEKATPAFWRGISRLGGALQKEDTMKDATMILGMFTETMPAGNFASLLRATVETKTLDPKLPGTLLELAKNHKSPVVRLALACASQRLTIEQRKPIVMALLAHEEDKGDHNLPLMYWYAAEPIVGADQAWAAEAIGACKIPKVTEFISRRLAEK